MRRGVTRLSAVAVAMFVAGWILVIAFGGNANAHGTTRVVWRVGGLMLYASVAILLCVGIGALVVAFRASLRRRTVDGR